jgi:glycopeptide antibiotics resistance protein
VVRNQVDASTDLLIPERFFVLHPQFLERPWDEYRPGWRYWKNIAINVVGFIPLGFFFYAYLSRVRQAKHPVALTIALGFAVSLTIEVLQAFLPTRDSGMTDLITNTFGTAVGVMAFRHKAVQSVLHKLLLNGLQTFGRSE